MNIGELEALLFEAFPREDAEAWDRPGLSVGDPLGEVAAVACALDATPENLRGAHEAGCNVLVTHHPAFLEPPFPMTPSPTTSSLAGAVAYEAARLGISLIAMHTNLDRSDAALDLAAQLLGLPRQGRLEEPGGYGAMLGACGLSLGELAGRCEAAFGTVPVVWGASDAALERVAFCSGSLGSLGELARARDVSCVVTGEAGYHRLCELSCSGVGAILLGHDASELPYAGLLAACIGRGAPDVRTQVLNERLRWHARAQRG